MRQSRSERTLLVLCILIVVLKLMLVAQNEILALSDDPSVYVRQSLRLWTLDFPPGYPVWLRLSRAFGVPQRIDIELLFITAAAFVAAKLRGLLGNVGAAITFALLAFTPSTFLLFNLSLSDGFFACLTLLGWGLSLCLFLARERLHVLGWSLALGLLLGFMASTRNEDPLIAFWILIVVIACAALASIERARVKRWRFWAKPAIAGVVTSAAAGVVILATGLSFYLADGVFARSITLIPGHQEMLKKMAEIETGEPQLRFVPISRKSRELAYSVSPTLARVRTGVEDPGYVFQVASRESGLPAGEIGGGWIWQAINGKMFGIAQGRLTNMEALYKQIDVELDAAFRSGRLRRRFVIHPLIGADLSGVVARLPASIPGVVISSFSAMPEYVHDQAFEARMFDEAVLRRSALVERTPDISIEGWAFVNQPGRKILNILVQSKYANSVAITPVDRRDVQKGFYARNGWEPFVIGFKASINGQATDDVSLKYVLDDGAQLTADHLKGVRVTSIDSPNRSGPSIFQGIDLIKLHTYGRMGRSHRLQLWLVHVTELSGFRWCTFAVVALAFLLNVYLWWRTRNPERVLWTVVFSFTLALWCARILFYSVIDAAAWRANQIRYLAPAHMLGVVLFSISLTLLVQFAVRPWRLVPKKKMQSELLDYEIAAAKG